MPVVDPYQVVQTVPQGVRSPSEVLSPMEHLGWYLRRLVEGGLNDSPPILATCLHQSDCPMYYRTAPANHRPTPTVSPSLTPTLHFSRET